MTHNDDLAEWLKEKLQVNAEVKPKMPIVRYERAADEGFQNCEMCQAELFNSDSADLFRWECLCEFEINELIDTYRAFKMTYDVLDVGSDGLIARSVFSLPW